MWAGEGGGQWVGVWVEGIRQGWGWGERNWKTDSTRSGSMYGANEGHLT